MSTPTPTGLEIGAQVRLLGPVPYLKTADPMPMLRPPDLVDPEEPGVVVERRVRDQLAVRFRRGTFLLTSSQLVPVRAPQTVQRPPLTAEITPAPAERSGDGEARPPAPPEALTPAPPD
ncbi:MAG: NAD(P)H dehydrogenase assembly family protein [Cyanobacteriota bacterium]